MSIGHHRCEGSGDLRNGVAGWFGVALLVLAGCRSGLQYRQDSYVPLRETGDGKKLSWRYDARLEMYEASWNGHVLKLSPGVSQVWLDGQDYPCSPPPLVVEGQPSLPAEVWAQLDKKSRTVLPSAVIPPSPALAPSRGRPSAPSLTRITPQPGWVVTRLHHWRFIVIHHSATSEGGASAFGRYHRSQRGWAGGLAYHFVVGNGTATREGQVEVGPRWKNQEHGAHAGVALYNEQGIGICLVGNFHTGRGLPSSRQLIASARLTAWLMGTYHIPLRNVLRHSDFRKTQCPGRRFPWQRFLVLVQKAFREGL